MKSRDLFAETEQGLDEIKQEREGKVALRTALPGEHQPMNRRHPPIPKDLQAAEISTFVDLFCGIGGFHYAAHGLGLKGVFACDIDEHCRLQYQNNFGLTPESDIKRVPVKDVPNHDLLLAGFPCQPFSIIGDMKGIEDHRGTLFHDILRILKGKQSKAVVLENVRQFSTINKGKVLRDVLAGLEQLGYECDWRVLNALRFGLPQKRERTIIVGFLTPGSLDRFRWPESQGDYAPLADMLEPEPDERHYVSDYIKAKRQKAHKPEITPSIWHENKAGNISSHPFSCALRANASYNYLLVDGERRLTPRELLRLQGFPEDFEIVGNDSQVRKQTGNAVPVPMIQAVIQEVMRAESQNARRHTKA